MGYRRRPSPIPLIIFAVLATLAGGLQWVHSVEFNQNCSGYLKRAADANTVELAREQLQIAVSFLESNNLTSGSTHIFWATPANDIGFWYTNLRSSLDELEAVDPEASQLEKSNVLIKLRETLMDTGKESSEVTTPPNMFLYPHQAFYDLWLWVSGLAAFVLLMRFGAFHSKP